MRIDAQFDPKELKKMKKALKKYPEECQKGMVSAINRSVKTVNTATQRAVTTRYNIKKSALNGGDAFKSDSSNNLFKPYYATKSDLRGGIDVRGSRLALVAKRGMITPTAPKSHKGKTMSQIKRIPYPSVKIIKGRKVRYPYSFIAKGNGGVIGLFSHGKTSRKISVQRTLSPANMVREKDIVQTTQKAARDALSKNIEHEIQYRLEKVSK